MKQYKILIVLVLSQIAALSVARAGAWIERISGDASQVEIGRGGEIVGASEMTRLNPGDKVTVRGAKTSVRILLGSGAVKEVNAARSPFMVPGETGNSTFLNNLVNGAGSLLASKSEQTETIAAMTRGRGTKIEILAAGDENFVYGGDEELLVAWGGGDGPYELTLSGAGDGKEMASGKDIAAYEFRLATNTLPAGEYRLAIGQKAGKSSAEATLSVVGREELPDEAQQLLDLGLDKRVEARLMISLLHTRPEWRLFAYSLAVRHELESERQIIERAK